MTNNMTAVFWPLINFVCAMPYSILRKTEVFKSFEKVANTNGTFKIHISALVEFGATDFRQALPLGTWFENDQWLVFADVNRMFYGMLEIYQCQPIECEHRKKLTMAMKIMEEIVALNELDDMMGSLSFDPAPVPAPAVNVSPIDELLARLSVT